MKRAPIRFVFALMTFSELLVYDLGGQFGTGFIIRFSYRKSPVVLCYNFELRQLCNESIDATFKSLLRIEYEREKNNL